MNRWGEGSYFKWVNDPARSHFKPMAVAPKIRYRWWWGANIWVPVDIEAAIKRGIVESLKQAGD